MKKSYKYRIYPTKEQIKLLEEQFFACSFLYNKLLEIHRDSWNNEKKSLSKFDLIKKVPELKTQFEFLTKIHSQVLQDVAKRVSLAFNSFFRRVKNKEKPGYPRFKSKYRYDSITYPQSNAFSIEKSHVNISKIGRLYIRKHRDLSGLQKILTIKKTNTGKWYVVISCDEVFIHPEIKEYINPVGIDLGISKFAVFSDTNIIENPRFLKAGESALLKASKALSKAEKGSEERSKKRKKLAKIHEKINNRKDNFSHQMSRKIVDNYDLIIVEDLNIKSMLRSNMRNLNKSIQEVSWDKFVQQLTYKAEEAGKKLLQVNPRNTSKTCSNCGKIVDKTLSERIHKCECGLNLDRDLNASLNILKLGLKELGLGTQSYNLTGYKNTDSKEGASKKPVSQVFRSPAL